MFRSRCEDPASAPSSMLDKTEEILNDIPRSFPQ